MEEGAVLEVYGEQRGGEEQIEFSIYFRGNIYTVPKILRYPAAQQTLIRGHLVTPNDANVADYEVRNFSLVVRR
ncbi:hypothetical protein niasHS_011127 [Heterodera schachtii]|uniref:Uncharacterized protein n=1 Tax=Heterodera schachtii TaxID=97005 RepID=A0ABD2J147_HETSC